MVLGSKETVISCKLCSHNKPLIRSHLIAKRIYALVGTEQEEPIIINSRVIMHSSRQTKDFLLCKECDNLLSKNGENWVIPKLARQNGQFLLADHLQNFPPDAEQENFKIYGVGKNSYIDVSKLSHFGMGVFWKASVHSWAGDRKMPMIELGPYGDRVRHFLLGTGRFPAHMSLHVMVAPKDHALVTIGQPYRGRAKAYRNFAFYVPGIQFVLYVGRQITDAIKQLCFYRNPSHPIVVYDTSERFFNIMREMARTAHKSKRIIRSFR